MNAVAPLVVLEGTVMIEGGSQTGRSQRHDEGDAAAQPAECEDRLVARSTVDEVMVVREVGERAALTSGGEGAESGVKEPSESRAARLKSLRIMLRASAERSAASVWSFVTRPHRS